MFAGDENGEDLGTHFFPNWCKQPASAIPGVGHTYDEKSANAAEARKGKSQESRLGWQSFSKFMANIHCWGTAMCTLKVCTPIELFSYIGVLLLVSEAHGGAKVSWWYDSYTRRDLARACARGAKDVSGFFQNLCVERLRLSKMANERAMSDIGKAAARRDTSTRSVDQSAGSSGQDTARGNPVRKPNENPQPQARAAGGRQGGRRQRGGAFGPYARAGAPPRN